MRAHDRHYLDLDGEPRGEVERLEAAIEILKPLRQVDRRWRPWERRLWDVPSAEASGMIRREDVRQQLTELVVEFNLSMDSHASSPTTRGVIEQLQTLGERALKLKRAIQALDRYALRAIELCVEEPDSIPDMDAALVKAIGEVAQADALEDSIYSMLVNGIGRLGWVDRLDALIELTEIARRVSVDRFGTGDIERPDAGGQTNVHRRFNPHPVWLLVVNAAVVFDRFRPRDLSAALRGPFDEFVCLLYEFATGKLAEDNRSELEWRIQKVARLIRRAWTIDEELIHLQGIRVASKRDRLPGVPEGAGATSKIKAVALQLMVVVDELVSGKAPAKEPHPKNLG